ncbi:MAG: (2Fe-2S)-binding protein [Desulfomicrobium escambiense]|nr:(2Fe-2S)-binding protein [Desulfomicrobium escambiense]
MASVQTATAGPSRAGFQIIDHENGMFSILGGKLTTYRLMAEKMVDVIMEQFRPEGSTAGLQICPWKGQDELSGYPLSKRLSSMDDIVCECELVTRQSVEHAINTMGTQYVGDIQHRTRLGMGPCQGGFCTYRALGIMQELGRVSPEVSISRS